MQAKLPPAVAEFDGVVILNAWMEMTDNRQYNLLAGHVTIHPNEMVIAQPTEDAAAAGVAPVTFRVKTAQGANFAAVLHGATETVLIFGCQIRGFVECPLEGLSGAVHVVR